MPSKDKAANKKAPSFRDRQQFPESNRFWGKLRLLVRGLMPRVRQSVRAYLRGVLSAFEAAARFRGRVTLPKSAQVGLFLTASVAIAVFAVFNVLYTQATTVSFDGVEIATVASEEEAVAARLAVEQSISDVLGYTYTMEDSLVSYSTSLTARHCAVHCYTCRRPSY